MAVLGTARDDAARRAAFSYLDGLFAASAEVTRAELEGFEFEGRQLKLIDQSRGIRNPSNFAATLSVITGLGKVRRRAGRRRARALRLPHRRRGDNVKLREAARLRVPVIYFRAIRPGVFVASYPVYITDMPERRCVLLAVGDDVHVLASPAAMSDAQRSYAERITRQRLHQPLFRARMLHAYERRCAVCSLQHPDLLDATHIVPDHDEGGAPVVSNGLALCKIHHAAFDRNLLGLRPDYVVRINQRLRVEVDGPMLRYGLQEMDGRRFQVPHRAQERPDASALARRWSEFEAS